MNIPDEDSRITDVATLFRRILEHVYDPLEPFAPTLADKDTPIRAVVGKSQQGDFQDVPVKVYVADVVMFGVYIKFYIT